MKIEKLMNLVNYGANKYAEGIITYREFISTGFEIFLSEYQEIIKKEQESLKNVRLEINKINYPDIED